MKPATPVPPLIVLVDKPAGVTSHDAVALCRRVFGTRKVGHAGTLDPMATGLLTLGVGSATRLLTHLVGLDKVYTATVRLGQRTLSDDRESEVLETANPSSIAQLVEDPDQIIAAFDDHTGEILQRPSVVSAMKINGERAYDLVRRGEMPELEARPVTVFAIDAGAPRVVELDEGIAVIDIEVTVHCSSGTYIRALARDVGAALGIGGHLTALRRTRVGAFRVDHAAGWDELEAAAPPRRPRRGEPAEVESESAREARERARAALTTLTPAEAAEAVMPLLSVSFEEAEALRHGKVLENSAEERGLAAAVSPDGQLIAIVKRGERKIRVETGFPEFQAAESSAGRGSAE